MCKTSYFDRFALFVLSGSFVILTSSLLKIFGILSVCFAIRFLCRLLRHLVAVSSKLLGLSRLCTFCSLTENWHLLLARVSTSSFSMCIITGALVSDPDAMMHGVVLSLAVPRLPSSAFGSIMSLHIKLSMSTMSVATRLALIWEAPCPLVVNSLKGYSNQCVLFLCLVL